MPSSVSPKQRLLQTAARLFFRNGYRAIGVDTISAESGIGKMTLYRHFDSKDDLIVAYLQGSDIKFWQEFDRITASAPAGREKLLAFFRALTAYVTASDCHGCPFLNVATEYPELDYSGHRIALAHKQVVRARFHELARQAGARDPGALGDGLFLLMDGAYMAARMFGPDNPGMQLAGAAEALIDAACDGQNKDRKRR